MAHRQAPQLFPSLRSAQEMSSWTRNDLEHHTYALAHDVDAMFSDSAPKIREDNIKLAIRVLVMGWHKRSTNLEVTTKLENLLHLRRVFTKSNMASSVKQAIMTHAGDSNGR